MGKVKLRRVGFLYREGIRNRDSPLMRFLVDQGCPKFE